LAQAMFDQHQPSDSQDCVAVLMTKRKWPPSGGAKSKRPRTDKAKHPSGATQPEESADAKAPGGSRTRVRHLPQRAVIVSSSAPYLAHQAAKEGTQLLQAVLEESGVDCDALDEDEDKVENERSALACLEAELAELQASSDLKHGCKRVRILTEVTRGLTVLACPQAEGVPLPSKLVEAVFAKQGKQTAERPDIRFVVRMVPLDIVMAPHQRNFRDAVEKHLPQLLAEVPKGSGWACSFHSRAMNTLTYKDVLAVFKEFTAPLELDLCVSEPDIMIVVEVNPLLCGISVLRGYHDALCECNLQRASEQGAGD